MKRADGWPRALRWWVLGLALGGLPAHAGAQGAAGAGQSQGLAKPPAPPPSKAPDDEVAVSVHVSPEPSNIGDLLTMEITVAFPAGHTVNLPTELTLAPFVLVEQVHGPAESTGSGARRVFRLVLQVFELGTHTIPGFDVTEVTASGEVRRVRVPAQNVNVESLTANTADPEPKPDDEPISLEYPAQWAELGALAILGALAFAMAGYWLRGVLRRRRKAPPPPPPVPPHERAYEALDRLVEADLLAQSRFVEHYVELTEIAKAYIEGRFGVVALDRTTDEIRQELLRHSDLAGLSPDEVIRFLQDADLVKFARATPEPETAAEAGYFVRAMVDRTKPSEASEGGAPEAAVGTGAATTGAAPMNAGDEPSSDRRAP